MEAKDRIIVALDVPTLPEASRIIRKLAPHVGAFKIGLELLYAHGAPRVIDLVLSHGGRLFIDGKFHDIPNTVASAIRASMQKNVLMFNVHCSGGRKMMMAARRAANDVAEKYAIPSPMVLGVTLLTSLDYNDLIEMGFREKKNFPPEQLLHFEKTNIGRIVASQALLAKECGLDGVISSPREAGFIRKTCGSKFLIVSPGIRGPEDPMDDQKRTMSPGEAILAGSDYLVIGRPILKNRFPLEAVKKITDEVESAQSVMQE
jgi:orotidine-5'-phosphate decarboxylase